MKSTAERKGKQLEQEDDCIHDAGDRASAAQEPPVVLDGVTGESVPFAAEEQNLREAESDLRSDEWVRDNALDAEPSPIPDPPRAPWRWAQA
jgi:hypothetical protein